MTPFERTRVLHEGNSFFVLEEKPSLPEYPLFCNTTHGVAALARRTWATAQQTPQLFASLEWWRAYYHFVRPHASLQVALMQPRERGGKRLARRYRQRTPAMAAGRTKRRWTARELLSCPLPPVCA